MSGHWTILPDVRDDIQARHRLLELSSTDLAAKWYLSLMDAVDRAADDPDQYPICPEAVSLDMPVRNVLFGAGRRPSQRVLFRQSVEDDGIVVLAVRHLHQRPLSGRELS